MDRNQWFSSHFLYLSEMKISFSPNWLYKWLFGNRFHNTQYLDYPKTIVRGLVHFVTPIVVLALLWVEYPDKYENWTRCRFLLLLILCLLGAFSRLNLKPKWRKSTLTILVDSKWFFNFREFGCAKAIILQNSGGNF